MIDNMIRKIEDWMLLYNLKTVLLVVFTCLIFKIQNSVIHLVPVYTNFSCTRTIMIPISGLFHSLSFNHLKPNNRIMCHFLFSMHHKVYKHTTVI